MQEQNRVEKFTQSTILYEDAGIIERHIHWWEYKTWSIILMRWP
jgi:hypothetical protein